MNEVLRIFSVDSFKIWKIDVNKQKLQSYYELYVQYAYVNLSTDYIECTVSQTKHGKEDPLINLL